jgi:alcohol dehydrogenase
VAGIHGDAPVPEFRPDVIVLKELRILGTRGTDLPEFRAAVELIASGKYPFAEVPSRTAPLSGMSELLAVLAGERDESAPPFAALLP